MPDRLRRSKTSKTAPMIAVQITAALWLGSSWSSAQPNAIAKGQPAGGSAPVESAGVGSTPAESAPVESAPAPETATDADRAAARSHAVAAFTSFDAARYEEAVSHFDQALALVDVPTLRVGRADAFVHLDKWLEALVDYQAAVSYVIQPQDSTSFEASQKSAATKLEALRARMPRLRIEASASQVQVAIDGQPSLPLLVNETLPLNPGKHTVVITAPTGSVTHIVDVEAGEVSVVEGPKPAHASKTEASTPTPAARSQNIEDDSSSALFTNVGISGTVTGILTLGAVATGVWFLVNRSEYEDQNSNPAVPYSEKERTHSRLETLAWVNTGLTAAAVAAAGVTTYFWVSPRFESPPSVGTDASSAFTVVPSGVTLGAMGQF